MPTPLERMYPARCYDCLAPIQHGPVLCPKCEEVYASERRRKARHIDGSEGGDGPH